MSAPALTLVPDDRGFGTVAEAAGVRMTEHDIRSHEITRSRRALAYLKAKLGDEAMRALLAEDVAETTRTVRGWVEASDGRWQVGEVSLRLPGPGAAAFRDWYAAVVAHGRSDLMRAGHPEHFLNTPGPDGIEVIEPVGETDLPWRITYRAIDADAELPAAWPQGFPVRFAAELIDGDGLRVGYSLRALRDLEDGLEMRLITCLPAAAPAGLVSRHLRHFMIEYRNWAVLASTAQKVKA